VNDCFQPKAGRQKSVDSSFSDYSRKKPLIGPRLLFLDWLSFPTIHFIDDNLKWFFAVGATHTLIVQSSLLKFPVGGVALLTMVALDIFHH